MILTRTNLSWMGKRLWLEDAAEGDALKMEYVHGEIGQAAHLTLEKKEDGKERQRITAP